MGNLTQNEARPVGHCLSCQNVGQRFVQRVHHVQGLLTSLLLYSLLCWSIREPLKLRVNGHNIVGQQLPPLRPFARSLKEPVKCGLSEMNNVIGMIMESRLWSGGFDSF